MGKKFSRTKKGKHILTVSGLVGAIMVIYSIILGISWTVFPADMLTTWPEAFLVAPAVMVVIISVVGLMGFAAWEIFDFREKYDNLFDWLWG